MPKIGPELSNARMYVYPDDHPPPHFHVLGPDTDCLISIETLQVIRGRFKPKDFAEVIAWAQANLDEIWAKWRELNAWD